MSFRSLSAKSDRLLGRRILNSTSNDADIMKIHRLTGRDWKRGRDIRLRALRDSPDAFGSTLEREVLFSESDWISRLDRKDAVTFVAASDEGKDLGLVGGAPYGADAGLFSMWVDPAARGRGVGTILVKAVIEWAIEMGYSKVRLDVGDHNLPATAFYERNGFTATGVTGTLPPPREHITEHQRERDLQA